MAKSIIGQNRDGTYIYGPDSVIAPTTPAPAPITPQSSGIPGVGIPQIPGMQPIVPRSLVNATYDESSPEAFKNSIVEKHPDGIASDGRAYKDIPAYEITKMIVDKYPEGVTNAGVPYKNYLVAPRNREEAVMWSPAFQQIKDAKKKRDDYLTGVTQHAEQTVSGISSLGARMDATIESIKKHPWEQMSTNGKQALEGSWLNDISNITAGTLGFATDVLPVTAATKMAFTEMRDNAVLQYVPKALDLVAEGAVGGLKMTGMDEETANNVVSTIFDLGFLRGGIRGQIKIADAYKARGLQGALETSALIIPQTMVDMALQPFNLGKTAYDFIKGKTSGKSGPQGAGDFKYESSTSGAKGESTQHNAQTSDGTPFTMDPEMAPSGFRTFRDKTFTKNATDNVELATRSVFPKATKEKGTKAKLNAGPIALAGIEQMYKDNRTGLTTADISTMQGGVEAVQQSLEHHGKIIGELTGKDNVVPVGDIIDTLKTAMQNPTTQYKGEMKNLANDIIDLLGNDAYKNGITIRDLQDHLSTIKSKIFTKHENISALYGEASGRAIKEFLDEISNRYDKAIEESSGDLPALKAAKKAYSSLKKIEKDLAASMLVNERNTKGGAMSKAGSIVGLYELLKNPTLSGIATSIITKTILNEMGSANTRGGAYEALIRNLDREALARGKSTSNSYSNPNDGNPRNNNGGVAPEGPVGGVDPTQKQIGAPATTKPAEPVSTTQVNPSPGAELANAFEKGITNSKGVTKKMPVQDMLDSYDVLTAEEKQIALDQSPRLREMVDINADVVDLNAFTKRYGPTELEVMVPLLTKKLSTVSDEAYTWFADNIKEPKGVSIMEMIQKENRKLQNLPEPVVEQKTPPKENTSEIQPKKKVEVKTSSTPESFQEKYLEYADDLYRIAKDAVENHVEDFYSYNPAIKITAKTKKGIQNQVMKQRTKVLTKEQQIITDALPSGMSEVDFFDQIKQEYVDSIKNRSDASSVDDAVAKAEAALEEKLAQVKADEMKKRGSPFQETPQVEGKTTVEVLKEWKPTKGDYSIENIDIKNTNAFPRSQYHRPEYINTDSYKYWLEQAKQGKEIPPIVVEKSDKGYHILDGYHRIAAAEDAGVKNIKALVLDTPIDKKGKPFTKFTDEELKNIASNKQSLPLSSKSEVKYSKPIEDNLIKEAKKYKSAEEFIKNVDVGGFVIDSSKIEKMAKSGVKNFKASEILSERGIKEMKDLGLDDADISFIDDLKPTTFAGAVHHGGSAPPYVGIRNPIGIEKSNIAKWLKDNKKPGQSIEDFYSQKLDSTILQELTHIRQLQLGRVDIEKIGKYNAPVEKPYLDYKNQKHEMTADKSEDFRYKRILTDIYNSSK